MVKRNPAAEALDEEAFTEAFEKPAAAGRRTPGRSAVAKITEGEPAWKRRNREPKHRGVQFRCSDSQLDLLQAASMSQEKSMQKILEAIVWPVLEEQYGVTEGQAPS